MRALLLNDNPLVTTILRLSLRRVGYDDVTAVTRSVDAWTLFQNATFDIVMVDIRLDGENGLDLVRRLRTDPESRNPHVAVLVLTALPDTAWRQRALDAGADEFARLPLTPDDFATVLEKIAHNRRQFVAAPDFIGPDRRQELDFNYRGRRRRNEDRSASTPLRPVKTG